MFESFLNGFWIRMRDGMVLNGFWIIFVWWNCIWLEWFLNVKTMRKQREFSSTNVKNLRQDIMAGVTPLCRVIPHHAPSKKSLRWPVHEASWSHFWRAKTVGEANSQIIRIQYEISSPLTTNPTQFTWNLLKNQIPFRCHHFSVPCVFRVKERGKHGKHSELPTAKSQATRIIAKTIIVTYLGSTSTCPSAQRRLDQHVNQQKNIKYIINIQAAAQRRPRNPDSLFPRPAGPWVKRRHASNSLEIQRMKRCAWHKFRTWATVCQPAHLLRSLYLQTWGSWWLWVLHICWPIACKGDP